MNSFKKGISIVCTVLFAVLLMAGGVRLLTEEKQTFSYFENRNLAQMPERTQETVADGSYFSNIELFLKEHAPLRDEVLVGKTKVDLELLKRPLVNDVVIGEDLLLPYNKYQVLDQADIEQKAEVIAQNLQAHSEQARAYGGEFYYVAVPCQYACLEEEYPWYMNNRKEYTDISSKALFDRLDEKKVRYIDMLQWYEEAGKPLSFTSTVDNHYGIEGAYDVYCELMKQINRDTGRDLEILEEGEYTLEELPHPYLGSRSRKIFGLWDSDEKLSVIKPKEEIPFRLFNYGGEVNNPSVYQIPQDINQEILYGIYMGGDISRTEIHTDREDLPSIFIYGDSFTNPVECLLWYGFDTMYSRDFRHDSATPEEIIREYQPEIVVCIRDYEALLAPGGNGQ